jgi:hypothetical protein
MLRFAGSFAALLRAVRDRESGETRYSSICCVRDGADFPDRGAELVDALLALALAAGSAALRAECHGVLGPARPLDTREGAVELALQICAPANELAGNDRIVAAGPALGGGAAGGRAGRQNEDRAIRGGKGRIGEGAERCRNHCGSQNYLAFHSLTPFKPAQQGRMATPLGLEMGRKGCRCLSGRLNRGADARGKGLEMKSGATLEAGSHRLIGFEAGRGGTVTVSLSRLFM